MESSFPSSAWRTVTQEAMETLLDKQANNNYKFFIPSNPSYYIENGILYSWDKKLWVEKIWSIDNGEISLQLSDSSLDNGDNVWDLRVKWIDYWSVIFHIPSFVPNISNFVLIFLKPLAMDALKL